VFKNFGLLSSELIIGKENIVYKKDAIISIKIKEK
jgi:hypothetical protein